MSQGKRTPNTVGIHKIIRAAREGLQMEDNRDPCEGPCAEERARRMLADTPASELGLFPDLSPSKIGF